MMNFRMVTQRTVNQLIGDFDDPQLMDSLELDVEYFREELSSRGLSRTPDVADSEDRPFSNLSDDELQQSYQDTVDRLVGDIDDPQLVDSLELDVEYFREELAARGLPRTAEQIRATTAGATGYW